MYVDRRSTRSPSSDGGNRIGPRNSGGEQFHGPNKNKVETTSETPFDSTLSLGDAAEEHGHHGSEQEDNRLEDGRRRWGASTKQNTTDRSPTEVTAAWQYTGTDQARQQFHCQFVLWKHAQRRYEPEKQFSFSGEFIKSYNNSNSLSFFVVTWSLSKDPEWPDKSKHKIFVSAF